MEIFSKILEPILNNYFSSIDFTNTEKERIATVRNMQIIIYSNDHNPPHFHVKSKDGSIDAKFKIEDCSLLKGEISNKEIKKVESFYSDPKTKIIMQKIWNKRIN